MIFTSKVFFSVACTDVLGRTNYIMMDTSVQHLLASLFLLLLVFLGEANAMKIFGGKKDFIYELRYEGAMLMRRNTVQGQRTYVIEQFSQHFFALAKSFKSKYLASIFLTFSLSVFKLHKFAVFSAAGDFLYSILFKNCAHAMTFP